jgi:diguanylate cyclase (GGDEF)-like protein/PAS domain S-box-containing protein
MTFTESRAAAFRSLNDSVLVDVLVGLPDPILVVDAAGSLLWGNRAAETFFGRSSASSVGQSGLALIHPDDIEYALLCLVAVQNKEIGAPIELRLLSATGWRLVELIGAPLGASYDGALVMSIRDLTDRRRFEVASDDIAKFRSLVHNASAVTMLVSAAGIVEAASGALARRLGQDPSAAAGHPLAELVELSDRPALTAALAAASGGPQGAATASTVEVEFRHVSGGPSVPFELTIVNLLEDPTVAGFVVSGHDITARKAIEAELLSTLSLLSATLDATDDGILVVDLKGEITSVNRKFGEMWRLPEEMRGVRDREAALSFVLDQLANPELFAAKIAELYAQPEAESHDVLHFVDGRVFDRYSQPQFVDGEIVGRVWSFRDVTERARLEAELAHQALHDSLTGLANQSLFRDRVDHALARLEHNAATLAVLFLDLDNFKTVNDSLGHSAGDQLLIAVTTCLEERLRAADTAARLGGDEFAILLEDAGCEQDVIDVAERLLDAVKRTFTIDGTEVAASVSIGIAFATRGMSCDQLLRNADLAMYAAKRKGKGRSEAYQPAMHSTAVERLKVEAELRRGIERGELTPYYQPIVDLGADRIVGVEALARWHHPTRGLLAPDAFMALADETLLIDDIDHLVLAQACADLRQWQDAGMAGPGFWVSVNLAPQHLIGDGLVSEVEAALAARGLDPACLVLEITEGAMMRDTDAAITNLVQLKALGVRIAVDDFGTGYSSLGYLQRFPIDILKIDKTFIDGVDVGPDGAALPHAIIRLAHTLHLTTIAEGVERDDQRSCLRDLGCELAQGYYFERAVPAEAIAARLLTSHAKAD